MFSVCLVASSGNSWEQQWSYVLSNFKPEKLYIIGEINRHVKPFSDYIQIDTAEEIDETLVLLAPQHGRYYQGDESIVGFNHPDCCCYMFGSDNVIISADQMGARKPNHTLYIPTSTNDDMYSFIAGAVTFYDRGFKIGESNNR